MKTQQTFTIFLPSKYGICSKTKKAKDFKHAFQKISLSDRMKEGWIEDEDGDTFTFYHILGIEETI